MALSSPKLPSAAAALARTSASGSVSISAIGLAALGSPMSFRHPIAAPLTPASASLSAAKLASKARISSRACIAHNATCRTLASGSVNAAITEVRARASPARPMARNAATRVAASGWLEPHSLPLSRFAPSEQHKCCNVTDCIFGMRRYCLVQRFNNSDIIEFAQRRNCIACYKGYPITYGSGQRLKRLGIGELSQSYGSGRSHTWIIIAQGCDQWLNCPCRPRVAKHQSCAKSDDASAHLHCGDQPRQSRVPEPSEHM